MWDAGLRRRSVVKAQVEHMFLGQYRHTLDNKGRLTIPARFRDALSDGAYITQGFDRNLRVLTVQAFERIYQGADRLSSTDPVARQLRRLIFASANLVEPDKVGRILIPHFLRDVAGLVDEAVVVGVGDSIEIWSPENWEKQVSLLQDADANAERFTALDLPPGEI
jgi:MraZ protein